MKPSSRQLEFASKAEIDPDFPLVERIRQGDEKAFRELIDRHYSRLFSTAYRMLNNKSDTEEALQEAMIGIHKALQTFEYTNKPVIVVILRIIKRKAVDLVRKRKPTVEYDSIRELPSGLDSPLENVIALQILEGIDRAITGDEVCHPDVLIMSAAGHSHREISSVLGISEASSRVRLSRSRLAAREVCQKDDC